MDEIESDKIRIIIADDHPLMRQALRNTLDKDANIEVIAEASDGEQAIRLVGELSPQLIFMDISMPKLNGIEATKIIKEKYPNVLVLVLTVHDELEHVLSILGFGADGYLTKSVYGEEILHAVYSTIAGDTVLSPNIAYQLRKQAQQNRTTKPVKLPYGDRLTGRQMELLFLAAKGFSNQEIAEKLGLTLRTVKSYFTDIYTILNVNNRTEAVVFALRSNLIDLSDDNI